MIEEAARLYRQTSAREEFEVRGPVVKLERAEGASTGRVTIVGIIDEQPRRVVLQLSGDDYDKAIEAHRSENAVLALGELQQDGRSFALRNPHNLEIEIDS